MNLFEKVIEEHSVEELLEEMKELQSRFGPETIAFLKNRSKGKPKPHEIGDSTTSRETGDQFNEGHEILHECETFKDRGGMSTLPEDGNKDNGTIAGEEGTEFKSTNKLQSVRPIYYFLKYFCILKKAT